MVCNRNMTTYVSRFASKFRVTTKYYERKAMSIEALYLEGLWAFLAELDLVRSR